MYRTGSLQASAAGDVAGMALEPAHHVQPFDNGAWRSDYLHGGLVNLPSRFVVTSEGEPFCPNPNDTLLQKEYETHVTITQRYPEMKTIEKTFHVKEVRSEEKILTEAKTRVVKKEHWTTRQVPVVKQVPRTRKQKVYRVIEEQVEVTDWVPVVEMVEVVTTEEVSRVITYDEEEDVEVPVIVEVPRVRRVIVPTGKFCDAPAAQYVSQLHPKSLLSYFMEPEPTVPFSSGPSLSQTPEKGESSQSLPQNPEPRNRLELSESIPEPTTQI